MARNLFTERFVQDDVDVLKARPVLWQVGPHVTRADPRDWTHEAAGVLILNSFSHYSHESESLKIMVFILLNLVYDIYIYIFFFYIFVIFKKKNLYKFK